MNCLFLGTIPWHRLPMAKAFGTGTYYGAGAMRGKWALA